MDDPVGILFTLTLGGTGLYEIMSWFPQAGEPGWVIQNIAMATALMGAIGVFLLALVLILQLYIE
jgi:hypothetical protein